MAVRPISAAATDAARAGSLFALWVTDSAGGGLTLLPGDILRGRKQFCSGAGHVQHAVVTARDLDGRIRLALAPLDRQVTVTPLAGGLAGVLRAANTGQVRFDQA